MNQQLAREPSKDVKEKEELYTLIIHESDIGMYDPCEGHGDICLKRQVHIEKRVHLDQWKTGVDVRTLGIFEVPSNG